LQGRIKLKSDGRRKDKKVKDKESKAVFIPSAHKSFWLAELKKSTYFFAEGSKAIRLETILEGKEKINVAGKRKVSAPSV